MSDKSPSWFLKEVQELTGRMSALISILLYLALKVFLFFQVLKKNKTFCWDDYCQQYFEELKKSVLVSSEAGKTLYLCPVFVG